MMICVYCKETEAQGNYSIHKDGFGIGKEVPLCDECGQDEYPTCHEIWMAISSKYRKEFINKNSSKQGICY